MRKRPTTSPGSGCCPPQQLASAGAPAGRLPAWLGLLFTAALGWAALYVHRNAGAFSPFVFDPGDTVDAVQARVPKEDPMSPMQHGRRLYAVYCTACHQSHGRGVAEQFPPLLQSEWVMAGGPNRLIRIVLNGMDGPLTVQGKEFNNPMLPWRDQMTDDEIAAVLTFVRNNRQWNHSASPVSSDQVRRIRDATADRTAYWTADELLAIRDAD